MNRFHAFIAACLLVPSLALAQSNDADVPKANPARPTISTPATLTPVGYLQFETGYLAAWNSPEFSTQSSTNEVVKLTVSKRIEFFASFEPFAYSRIQNQASTDPGGISLGAQGVLFKGEGAKPTVALSYARQVYSGSAPDLDIGSPINSLTLLISADVKGFHYDTNYIVNEVSDEIVRRGQSGQTLSVSHDLPHRLGLTGEIWHYSQPLAHGNAVGNLWALNYNARKNLVFDGGFDHGLTSTSTRWEAFVGFTYLLPHKLSLHRAR